MSGELTIIEGSVRDHFVIEGRLFSTCLADAHKAIDKYSHVPVLLWVMRLPVDLNAGEARAFTARIDTFQRVNPRVVNILSSGVDSNGIGFVAMPPLNGFPLLSGQIEVVEAERRFAACLELMEYIHNAGLICGDISGSSFWMNRNGHVTFIGAMGLWGEWQTKFAEIMTPASLPFMAPEVREEGKLSQQADVFALGVLGYELLANEHPVDKESEERGIHLVRPLQRITNSPIPLWSDPVLMKCLEYDPAARYNTAREIREAIREIKRESFLSSLVPAKVLTTPEVHKDAFDDSQNTLITGPSVTRAGAEDTFGKESVSNKERQRAIFLGATCFGVLFLLLVVLFGNKLFHANKDNLAAQLDGTANNQQVQKAVDMIGGSKNEQPLDQKYFTDLANSDDPVAHDTLVKLAVTPQSDQVRALAEKALLDRAARLGFKRASIQVKVWLASLPSGPMPAYEGFLRVIDPTIPLEARVDLLKKGFPEAPTDTLRVAVALALDNSNPEIYRPIIAEFLKIIRGADVPNDITVPIMIWLSADLTDVFGKDILGQLPSVPDTQLLNLVSILAERKNLHLKDVIVEVRKRNLISPLRIVFLEPLGNQENLQPEALVALVHAAVGALKLEDIKGLGGWYFAENEKAFLALLADIKDSQLLLSVFDLFAARNINSEPAQSIVQWIKGKQWEQRGDYARLVGILSNYDRIPAETLEDVYPLIDRFINTSGFVEVLLDVAQPFVIKYIIQKYPKLISLSRALNLLLSPDREVKLSGMDFLKGTNDISVFKIIIDRYEKETDPIVREAYKEKFWFVKQRAERSL